MKPTMYVLMLGTLALFTCNIANAFTSLVVISKPVSTTTIKNLRRVSAEGFSIIVAVEILY